MPDLYAAAARRLINPPLGVRRAGIRIFADPIRTIESDLTATAVVLSDGDTRLAIIALDLCLMSMREMTELRSRIACAVDTRPSQVMVNLSHTHSSPALPDFIPDTTEQMDLKKQYRDHLFESAAAAAEEAAGRLLPAGRPNSRSCRPISSCGRQACRHRTSDPRYGSSPTGPLAP